MRLTGGLHVQVIEQWSLYRAGCALGIALTAMHIEGREYRVVVATNVDRDAMQWECYLVDGNSEKLVFEIVRFDGKREWSFLQHVESIPLAVVEYAVQHARAELGPFFNG